MKQTRRSLAALGFLVFTACLTLAPIALAQDHPTVTHKEAGEHDPVHGGGGHGEHGIDPKRLAFQFINFGILVAIVAFAGGKAINKALAARHDQMKKDLSEASAQRAEALARLKEQEGRLANLEAEVTRLKASIKDEAEKEEQRLLAGAEEKATRIQHETQFLVDQQVKEAERSFRAEVAGAAARIAEEIVRRSVKPEDETRLQQGFVADLESAKEARS